MTLPILGKMTICVTCVHYLNMEPGTVREEADYNRLCRAAPLPEKMDPVDGKIKSYRYVDNALQYSYDEYKTCREMNPDGRCTSYTEVLS